MKILAFTDIHGRVENFNAIRPQIEAADLIVLAGDITHFGRAEQAEHIIESLAQMNNNILAVHGNCDYSDVLTFLENQSVSLHGRVIVNGDIQFAGLGGSTPCPGKTPSEYTEAELGELLSITREQLDPALFTVFVSHQPPLSTVNDRLPNGKNVGSTAVREFITAVQPDICITGHIHEGAGKDQIGRTTTVNPGPFHLGHYLELVIINKQITMQIRNIES